MSLIPDSEQDKLRAHFDETLKGDVRLTLYTQHDSPIVVPGRDCPTCAPAQELATELSGLSDKIELEVKDFFEDPAAAREEGVGHIPAMVLQGASKGNVRFFGLPTGNEFPGFISG